MENCIMLHFYCPLAFKILKIDDTKNNEVFSLIKYK